LSLKQTPYTQADILAARASLEQAQVQLASAQASLDGAIITAPYTGIVGAVGINPGESTGSSSTITLVDPAKVRVDVQVDESDIAQVQVGQNATVSFDALGQRPFNGKVAAISPSGTTSQGVVGYLVTIELQNGRGVRPGMTATAQLIIDQRDDVLLVPNRALTRPTGPGSAGGNQGAARNQGGAGNPPGTFNQETTGNQGAAGGQGAATGGQNRGQAQGQGRAQSQGQGTEGAQVAAQVRARNVQVQTASGTETRTVQVGLANDQNTEVTSGLEEGDVVILPVTQSRASVPGAGSPGGGSTFQFGGGAARPAGR